MLDLVSALDGKVYKQERVKAKVSELEMERVSVLLKMLVAYKLYKSDNPHQPHLQVYQSLRSNPKTIRAIKTFFL